MVQGKFKSSDFDFKSHSKNEILVRKYMSLGFKDKRLKVKF